MTDNSLAHPSPVQPADRLAEALRNELLEYGHLLELLRTQQRLVLEENLMELPENIGAVNQQMRNIVLFRKQREYWREETLCWLKSAADLHWGQMSDLLPTKYQLLF